MVEHLNIAIYWHAIHAWWRKSSILDMAPKWRDIMADMVIAKCMRNRWLNALHCSITTRIIYPLLIRNVSVHKL